MTTERLLPTADPFFIQGPALISFSGGRTSAYMLWRILQAHGGTLPTDVVVAFANTGKEREETLRFVHECGSRWGVQVHWVEWRPPATFEEVGFNSADRTGKWFAELMRRKQFVPNSQMRYCTSKLKVETMKKFMVSLGYKNWINPVGLRYDEGHRVLKQLARNDAGKERFTAVMPLAKARVTKPDVMRFWLGSNADPKRLTFPLPQGFDLGLRDYEGNCDLCFLKGRGKLAALIRENPGIEEFWAQAEERATARNQSGARFRAEESVRQLAAAVASQGVLDVLSDDEHDVECGLWCAGEAA